MAAWDIERVGLFQYFGAKLVIRSEKGLEARQSEALLQPFGMPFGRVIRALQIGEPVYRWPLDPELPFSQG